MISFDSVKLLIPAKYLDRIDLGFFNKANRETQKGVVSWHYIRDKGVPEGISRVEYRELEAEVVFMISSKILHPEHKGLINLETIPLVYEKILQLGFCEFDIAEVYEETYVLRCDVTDV